MANSRERPINVAPFIESFIEGRARLRSPLLRDKALASQLSAGLLAVGGVTRAEANPRTGGLLLEYDRSRLPLERVMDAAPVLQRVAALEELPASERPAALAPLLEELRELLG